MNSMRLYAIFLAVLFIPFNLNSTYTTPCASMALATFIKPATLAPLT